MHGTATVSVLRASRTAGRTIHLVEGMGTMLGTMANEKKKVDPRHSKRLLALQEKFGLTDEQMADKFGVEFRTYISWKYKERNPSKSALVLLGMFEQQAKK